MTVYATRLANSLDTAARMRRADGMAYTPNGVAGLARSGLRPDGGGGVAITNGTMNVTVQPFAAWLDGTTSDAQGGYPFVSDSAVNLTVAAGHATLARVDTVVAQVRETAVDGSGFTDARVYLLQGSPGAGAPALPATAIALRDINVPAGASAGTGGLTAANLGADRRQYVVGVGGVLPVATASERNALVSPQEGAMVYRKDTDHVEVYDGAAWRTFRPQLIQSGTVTFGTINAGAFATPVPVTFPTPYASAPRVLVSSGHSRVTVATSAVTATGFTFDAGNWSPSSASAPVGTWVAIGD